MANPRTSSEPGWDFWIDRGGTFTDLVAFRAGRPLEVRKVLSDDPSQTVDPAVSAIVDVLDGSGDERIVNSIRMGTTVGTNALLERRGARTLLLVTRGFRDGLVIGYQNRPDIFSLDISRPVPLSERVIEVDERLDADGNVIDPLCTEGLEQALAHLVETGFDAVAVCFLHAHKNPEHEQTVGRLARQAGFQQVSLSHEVLPLRKWVRRGDTTVVDAYLSPVLSDYLEQFRDGLAKHGVKPRRILFMQSNGGLVDQRRFRGRDCILSGPAGGLVGMTRASGRDRVIGFDMGGTSTDVSLHDGDYEYVDDFEIDGIRVAVPILRIHTVAAGGGSVLSFADGRMQVGPRSAGAIPGPCAYGRGGPLTVTDANVLLGRVLPDYFPKRFGSDGQAGLDRERVAAEFATLTERINASTDERYSPERAAEGFLQIAIDNMANAIKQVSIRRGLDPGDFALCCFGGAGGQHACAVADQLGVSQIVIHPLAGVLSAFGMGVAKLSAYYVESVGEVLQATLMQGLAERIETLVARGQAALRDQGWTDNTVSIERIINLKCPGTEAALPIPFASVDAMRADFIEQHRSRFGYDPDDQSLVVESIRVDVRSAAELPAVDAPKGDRRNDSPTNRPVYVDGRWRDTTVVAESSLAPGEQLAGPALVPGATGTTFVAPGWTLQVDDERRLQLERRQARNVERLAATANPMTLEIFNNRFMHIAEQMGNVLGSTARSVNIKERLDFSCALFDADGQLIANAPHIPVHLGAMSDSVMATINDCGERMASGDVFMLNSPYMGGSHLPDITVVTPVFVGERRRPDFFVACRAHHADIGGKSPGSMPPHSQTIDEEGVVFGSYRIVRNGRFLTDRVRHLFESGDWPARNVAQNIADLKAQVAANEFGTRLVRKLVDDCGLDTVHFFMAAVQDNAESAVRDAISQLESGRCDYVLDGDLIVRVRVDVDPRYRSATVDFTGTSAQHAGNFNAPLAVTRATVLYVFRTLVARNIPLNAGCLRPLTLIVPDASLLNPRPPAAVAAGNVETAQCVCNALLAALKASAAGQGTMNNITFGDARVQYYETLCGGAGAGRDFDGADAVHTHMTNSRITDPEVLEQRLPVIVREFAIRHGSGGNGMRHGGNGARRTLEFRRPLELGIVSNHRDTTPAGLAGGGDGQSGRNVVVRANGNEEALSGVASTNVVAGDRLTIETPGGGGYGEPGGD